MVRLKQDHSSLSRNILSFIAMATLTFVAWVTSGYVTKAEENNHNRLPAAAQDSVSIEVKSEKVKSEKQKFIICHLGKDVRWIRVDVLDSGRCKTLYSKEGLQQVVSSASYYTSCEAVMTTIRKNIEEGGYKCKDGKLATIIETE